MQSRFLFVTCQAGAESALKEEMAREHPELRFAYSRPGFLTFKHKEEAGLYDLEFELISVFARAYGLSLGKAATPEEILTIARTRFDERSPARLHVWERERRSPAEGEDKTGAGTDDKAQAVTQAEGEARAALSPAVTQLAAALAAGPFKVGEAAEVGERVFDVVIVEEGEYWLGVHRHTAARSPHPGAIPSLELPAGAPSRSYLKMQEALAWSGAPLHAGDLVVEIGCAPGGVSAALLERGVRVIGIDQAPADRSVLAHPNFQQIRSLAEWVSLKQIPEQVDWIVLDINLAPDRALSIFERFAKSRKQSLLGVILTLKLNQWELAAEIPAHLARVAAFGMKELRARQLPSNRQEYTVYGLTRDGGRRLRGDKFHRRKRAARAAGTGRQSS